MSGLGISCCQNRDIPALSSDNDRNNKIDCARKREVNKNNSETEADSSSHSVALVIASANLHNDALCLPQDPTESINGGTHGDNNNKENCMDHVERKKKRRGRGNSKPREDRFMTLQFNPKSLINGRQYLTKPIMEANGWTKPGLITLLGQDGRKWRARLRGESNGRLALGKGWKEFAKANGLTLGKYFTFELVWENGVPMLSLFYKDSDRRQVGECSKASERESFSTELSIGNKTKKAKNNIDDRSNSSSLIQHRFVTLALVPEDVKACTLHLPSQFLKANGIKKLGKLTLVGKDDMKFWGYLGSRDGTVAVGNGWSDFCEANGVKMGESFILKFLYEEEDTSPVFKFYPVYCI